MINYVNALSLCEWYELVRCSLSKCNKRSQIFSFSKQYFLRHPRSLWQCFFIDRNCYQLLLDLKLFLPVVFFFFHFSLLYKELFQSQSALSVSVFLWDVFLWGIFYSYANVSFRYILFLCILSVVFHFLATVFSQYWPICCVESYVHILLLYIMFWSR